MGSISRYHLLVMLFLLASCASPPGPPPVSPSATMPSPDRALSPPAPLPEPTAPSPPQPAEGRAGPASPPAPEAACINRYMATEIAFCHAGYVDSPELVASPADWLNWAEREARLVAPLHRLCAPAQATRIRYRVDGELVGVERAVATGQLEQVLVEYDNGLKIYVNRHPTQEWPVPLDAFPSWAGFSALVDGARQDFVGRPQTALFILPPDGWVAVMP